MAVSPAELEIVDASPAEIVVSSSLTVSEDSRISSYRVSLTSQPIGTVHVIVSIEDVADSQIRLLGAAGSAAMLTLEFDSASENWDSGQEVELVVADNDYLEENRTETIIHRASGGGYDGAQPKDLSVTIDDDEAAVGVSMSMTVSRGTEGSSHLVYLLVQLVDSDGEVARTKEETTEVTLEFSPVEVAEDYTFVFPGLPTAQIPSDRGGVFCL